LGEICDSCILFTFVEGALYVQKYGLDGP